MAVTRSMTKKDDEQKNGDSKPPATPETHRTARTKTTGERQRNVNANKVKSNRRSKAKPFRFLDLPSELRNRIYKFAVAEEKPIVSKARSIKYLSAKHPPLTRVSRQLRNESLRLFYHENTFRFEAEAKSAFRSHVGTDLGEIQNYVDDIHKIEIGVGCSHGFYYAVDLSKGLGAAKITIGPNPPDPKAKFGCVIRRSELQRGQDFIDSLAAVNEGAQRKSLTVEQFTELLRIMHRRGN